MAVRDYMDSLRYAAEAYPRIPYKTPELPDLSDISVDPMDRVIRDLIHARLKTYADLNWVWTPDIKLQAPTEHTDVWTQTRYWDWSPPPMIQIGGITMEKTFTKKDLRSGYVVEFRNGIKRLVTKTGSFVQILVNPESGEWNYLNSNWNEDLTFKTGSQCIPPNENECKCPSVYAEDYDIVKVWGLVTRTVDYCKSLTTNTDNRALIWEREIVKKLTVDEVSKLLGYKVEIVGEGK